MGTERSLLDGHHRVLTPEYVEFDFVLAGLFSRFLAWGLDSLITVVVAIVVITVLSFATALVTLATRLNIGGFVGALYFIIWFLIDWGYAIVFEAAWAGQTIGKRALGLRVIQDSGVRIGFWQAALRNLVRPIDRLPLFYLAGATTSLFSATQQRLGDILAGTVVVRERQLKIPSSLARPEGETALLSDALFQQRVGKLTDEEESLIFTAALRREELGLEARLKLFAAIAQRLQDDVGFFKPPNLSDEKLVLLVAAALVQSSAKKAGLGRTTGR